MKRKTGIPQRQCTGCRKMKNKEQLLRVIRTQEGEVLLDPSGRLNGRGAYLCRDKACLAKARKNHSLERSFRMAIPDSVYDALEKELEVLE